MRFRSRIGVFMALVAAVAMVFGSITPVTAQDATPSSDATPVGVECVSPGLPPGTPTPMEELMEGMDMASPEAMDDMGMASPEAMGEMASPEAEGEDMMMMPDPTPLPEGQPADEETAAAIEAALRNFEACYNEGQATGDPSLYVALETANYWASVGYGNPYDRVADEIGSPFPSASIANISDPMVYDDGRVSADIDLVLDHWIQRLRVFLTEEDGIWKWDAEATLQPDVSDFETVSVNGVNLVEINDEETGERTYGFEFLGSPTIQQTEALVFNVTNTGEELHEAIVVQLPEGADPMGLLDGSIPFEEVVFYGGVFGIAPGQTMDLALVNMEPGTYQMLCFFPSPEGVPHIALGMIADFEIVPPAEE